MQLLSCHVAVAGDDQNIVVRDHDTAVTYPELLVLKALHGPENVRHVADVGDVERDPEEERTRLATIYTRDVIKQVFPGDHMALPEFDPRMRKQDTVFDEAADTKATPAHERQVPRQAHGGKHR